MMSLLQWSSTEIQSHYTLRKNESRNPYMSYSVIESENVRSRDVLSRAGNQIWKIGLICLKKKNETVVLSNDHLRNRTTQIGVRGGF